MHRELKFPNLGVTPSSGAKCNQLSLFEMSRQFLACGDHALNEGLGLDASTLLRAPHPFRLSPLPGASM